MPSDAGQASDATTSDTSDAGPVNVETETDSAADDETETETGTDPPPIVDMGPPPDPNQQTPGFDEEGCPVIYAQNLLPTFELEINPVVWELLMDEWLEGADNKDAGLDYKPYHPLQEFKYGEISIHDAQIRLRGNPNAWYPDDKLQFQIGFHTNNPDGNFLGIKRLVLEAATFNRHMLRDRLALAVMRDVGIRAPCANHARVDINGEYYGIYTNIEKVDEAFLERTFDDPTGDLWKRANWQLKTNEDTSNSDRLEALIDADSVEELETYLDIEQAMRGFAAEAIIPDSDGMWAGGLNFYLYDEPISGKFMLLPWDMDGSFERFNDPPGGDFPADPDPFVWERKTSHGRPFYDIPLEEEDWFERYIELIDEILHEAYTPAKMHAHIDTMTAQIQDSVFEDVNKPFSNEIYMEKLDELHAFVDTRYAFIEEWLACWQDGGEADNDGYCEEP